MVVNIIFIYGLCLCIFRFKDYLHTEINSHINFWVISHFFFYLIIGYFFPETFWLSMTIGVVWEIYEDFLEKFSKKHLSLISLKICKLDNFTWWYGRYEDVIANMLGFLLGQYMSLHWKRR
jgi:hypothetical protein